MAEQAPHHLPADREEGEAHSTDVNHISASDEQKHKETGASVLSTAHLEDGETAEGKMVLPVQTVSPPEDGSLLGVEDSSTSPQADDESCGDRNRLTQRNEQVAVKEPEVGEQGTAKTTTPAAPIDREDDHEVGPKSRLDKETPETNSTDAEAKDDGSTLETAKNTPSPQRVLPQEISDEETLRGDERKPTETIGPSTPDGVDGTAPVIPEGGGGEPEVGEQGTAKTTTPAALIDREDDHEVGPKSRLEIETPETNGADAEAKEDGSNLETAKNTPSPQRVLPQVLSGKERKPTETIGPSTPDGIHGTAPVNPEGGGGIGRYLFPLIIVVVVAILVQLFLPRVLESSPQKKEAPQIDVFLRQMEALQSRFPKQRADLWKRSRIHLLRHLQTAQPTEPVSLMLTAGARAERTLRCLAQDLASAFSTSLNASVLHIDGAGRASQDSDQVKLDIDSKLQGAFEGDQPVAVIHRFEELPPGSTLIFYRYCDHENAAYKRTFLIFTVLLGEEEEIPAQSRLSEVEEMVDDHLQKKFLSDDQPVAFDKMDLDKYGGLWSRISHLILPVTAEERMERHGC